MKNEIKQLSSRVVYENRWMRLREDKIIRPDGSEGLFSVVDKVDSVIIIPVMGDEILCVEQYRYPIGAKTVELPQGSWELLPDSLPEDVAAGELLEETGMVASELINLGYQKLAQGYSSQGYHIFLARGLSFRGQQLEVDEQDLTVKKINKLEFFHMILNGQITDATTVTAFLLAKAKQLI